MPKTARSILEAALAALDDEERQTSAERLAGPPRGSGHNDPFTPSPKEGEAVKYPTDLARVIAQRERFLAEQEGDS